MFEQVEQHQFLPRFSSVQKELEITSPSPSDNQSSKAYNEYESGTSSEVQERLIQLQQIQQSCLFAPLQSVLKSLCSEPGLFEEPAVVNSLKCLKQVSFNQGHEERATDSKKQKGEKGSLDELISILYPTSDVSRTLRSDCTILKEVEVGLKNIQDQLKEIFSQEITKTRPLLPDELSSRLTMMRLPLRGVVEAEREARVYDNIKIRRGRQKRFLPSRGVRLMKEWLKKNSSNPYPSAEQKSEFARKGKLQPKQVEYWFINARARICGKRSRSRKW
jgi:hypothetical protein